MQKSLKSRRVRPHGKHARFQETTIAFQLKENKRLVKESRTAYTPPNPPSARAPPKRYVHSLVEPRSPRTRQCLYWWTGWICLAVRPWGQVAQHSLLLAGCVPFPLSTKWPCLYSVALCFFLGQVQVLSGSQRLNCAGQGIDKTHSM